MGPSQNQCECHCSERVPDHPTQWMFDDDAFYKNFLKRIPIGRLGKPEDFIVTVVFLSSKASDFMTGAVLYVDGGYTAG